MKFNQDKSLSESVIAGGLELANSARWRDRMTSVREGYRRKNNRSMPNDIVSTTAILLENTYKYANSMNEMTRQVNLGTFVDYGFDVISAAIPNLITPDIVSMQPMNAKHGAIFYLQYLYGNTKGSVTAGTVMNSPFTGAALNTDFTGEHIDGEVVGTTDGTEDEFSTSLAYTPIRPGSVSVYLDSTLVFTDDGEGAFTATGVTGTIDYATGAIAVTYTAAPATGKTLSARYNYNMDLTTVGFSQVDLDLKSISIEAFPRKIRSRWLLDAAFELEKMKGIDAENELIVAMSSEIKYEIDGSILMELYKLAGNTGYTWSAQMPASVTGISYIEYKQTLLDVFTEMSNDIFLQTKRVGANYIIAGMNVCNIIETLPTFEAEKLGTKIINGPHMIGTLNGKWAVYKNPFYGENNFLMGYKGASYLDAGFVYAPYMPLYTTPTHVEDDFVFRKGMATSYGQVMLNNKLYAKGSISDYSADRYKPAAAG